MNTTLFKTIKANPGGAAVFFAAFATVTFMLFI
jgi:hypothetical protein